MDTYASGSVTISLLERREAFHNNGELNFFETVKRADKSERERFRIKGVNEEKLEV